MNFYQLKKKKINYKIYYIIEIDVSYRVNNRKVFLKHEVIFIYDLLNLIYRCQTILKVKNVNF